MRVVLASSPARPDVPNEDFVAASDSGVVLLDGAGLSGAASQCRHGVAWFTRHLGGAILANLSDTARDLVTILADAMGETAQLHAGTCRLDVDPGTPSSTVVIARARADQLQYLVLADSVLVLETGTDQPTVVTDTREADVGAALRTDMDAYPNGTPEHEQAHRSYVEALRSHRNRPGGFWVAAADPASARQALTGEVPLPELRSALLMSDGASRLADRFAVASWRQLLDLSSACGPGELITRVREAELSDPRGSRWPRGKVHDDATVAHVTFP
jgi:hypothetical protein